MKLGILVVTALLVAPGAALAQTPQERIDAAMERALAAGVPVSLIEAKIAEGRAKGVPMERLAAAIERREAALERARSAMGSARGDVDADELSVAGDAIGAGVSEAVLARLSEITDGDRRAVAIAALTQLVASGQVPEQALARVTEALARGDDALASLPAQAAEAAARRGPPAGAGRPGMAGAHGAGASQVPMGPPAGVPAPGRRPTTIPPVSTPSPGTPPVTPPAGG